MNFTEQTVKEIVERNITNVTGTPNRSVLMPDQIVKIVTKSIYDSIMKYHESLKRSPR